jgi:hypothetical protein
MTLEELDLQIKFRKEEYWKNKEAGLLKSRIYRFMKNPITKVNPPPQKQK